MKNGLRKPDINKSMELLQKYLKQEGIKFQRKKCECGFQFCQLGCLWCLDQKTITTYGINIVNHKFSYGKYKNHSYAYVLCTDLEYCKEQQPNTKAYHLVQLLKLSATPKTDLNTDNIIIIK